MTKLKATQKRIDAIDAIDSLTGDSTENEILNTYEACQAVFGRLAVFEPVERQMWDVALAGGCVYLLAVRLIEFKNNVYFS